MSGNADSGEIPWDEDTSVRPQDLIFAPPDSAEELEPADEPQAHDVRPEGADAGSILPGLPRGADAGRQVGATIVGDAVDAALFDADDAPFDHPNVEKLGIIGGKGVGKSYLFQAMVYRTCAGAQSGALTYYLEDGAARLFSALRQGGRASTVNLARFIKNYAVWRRLPTTTLIEQKWYRLRLPYRTGLLGRRRSALDVEFFDGSGEGFFQAVQDADNRRLWRDGYLHARVMVFCLPLWVAFPDAGLSQEDWQMRDETLEGFEQVVQNYTDLRSLNQQTHPVSAILALTMADDPRTSLKALRDRWIFPYIDSAPTYLQQLRRESGVARYLANARKVSEALEQEFNMSQDLLVAAIPQKLDFGAGKPWLIPLSAIEGDALEDIELKYEHSGKRPRVPAPVPAHVELPLLVALCERHNSLM